MYENGIEFMHRKKETMTGIGGCVHREGGGLFILKKRRLKRDKINKLRAVKWSCREHKPTFSLLPGWSRREGVSVDSTRRVCLQTQEDSIICKYDQTVEQAVPRSFGVIYFFYLILFLNFT